MKTKRTEFIEAMLITKGKVTAEDIAENFAMKAPSALVDIFGYLKKHPTLVDKSRGENFLVRINDNVGEFEITKKRAKELLAAFEVVRKNQDSNDRLTIRYAYIEAVLIKYNKLGRDEIARAFELAGAAATRTMQGYVELAPENIDMHGRRYHVKGENFKAKYLNVERKDEEKSAQKLISALETIVGEHILDPTQSKMWRKERGKEEKPGRTYRR